MRHVIGKGLRKVSSLRLFPPESRSSRKIMREEDKEMPPPIATERIYAFIKKTRPPGEAAVLCDRLWPRGLRKEDLAGVLWMREWAPTTSLRQDFHAGRISPAVFRERYRAELLARRESLLADLGQLGVGQAGGDGAPTGKTLRLLTASREIELSHVPVLRDYLEELLIPRPTP